MRSSATLASTLEVMRLQYQYKRLVLLGKARLPVAAAARLVGPDCAYHLYGRSATGRRAGPRKVRRRP